LVEPLPLDLGREELVKPVLDSVCSLGNDGTLLGGVTELKEGGEYKGCFNGTIQVKVFLVLYITSLMVQM